MSWTTMNIQFICGTSISAIDLCFSFFFQTICCFSYKSYRLAGNERKLTMPLRRRPKKVRMGNVGWIYTLEYNELMAILGH